MNVPRNICARAYGPRECVRASTVSRTQSHPSYLKLGARLGSLFVYVSVLMWTYIRRLYWSARASGLVSFSFSFSLRVALVAIGGRTSLSSFPMGTILHGIYNNNGHGRGRRVDLYLPVRFSFSTTLCPGLFSPLSALFPPLALFVLFPAFTTVSTRCVSPLCCL